MDYLLVELTYPSQPLSQNNLPGFLKREPMPSACLGRPLVAISASQHRVFEQEEREVWNSPPAWTSGLQPQTLQGPIPSFFTQAGH